MEVKGLNCHLLIHPFTQILELNSQYGGNIQNASYTNSIMLSRWGVKSRNVRLQQINKLSLNLKSKRAVCNNGTSLPLSVILFAPPLSPPFLSTFSTFCFVPLLYCLSLSPSPFFFFSVFG